VDLNVFLIIAIAFPQLVYLTNRPAGWLYWDASICLRFLCSHKSVLLRNGQQCFIFKYARQLFSLINVNTGISFFSWHNTPPQWAMTSSFTRFLDHTQRRTTVGRTPLDEWSARFRDLYLTTHKAQHRQTSMLPERFEPKISAGERPQTYALDRAATGTGSIWN
jgi:hypothetical protein